MVEDPGKEFYERCKSKGLDYNVYGHWQETYGKFFVSVSNIMPKLQKDTMRLLDVGTACGVNLRGIKNTGVFKGGVVGVDSSPFLINLGKQTHGFKDEEMMVMDALQLTEYFDPESFDVIHCSQVLEHIQEYQIQEVLKGFHKLLIPGGVLFLVVDAVSPGQSAEELKAKEDSHVTLRPRKWFADQVTKVFRLDAEAHQRFQRTKFSPDNSAKTFYDYYQSEWALIVATKK
jgi:ubiquinone/menaquinone biosynthesis C-methylase UbiE